MYSETKMISNMQSRRRAHPRCHCNTHKFLRCSCLLRLARSFSCSHVSFRATFKLWKVYFSVWSCGSAHRWHYEGLDKIIRKSVYIRRTSPQRVTPWKFHVFFRNTLLLVWVFLFCFVLFFPARIINFTFLISCFISCFLEDFSYFAQQLPSCYFFIGCAAPGRKKVSNHSAAFVLDERCLSIGASIWVQLVRYASRVPHAIFFWHAHAEF